MTVTRRYPSMRGLMVALVALGLVAACGSPADPASGREQADDSLPSASTPTTSTLVASDSGSVTTTVPGERPVAYPEEGLPPEEDPQERLSIEDALLPDDAFGAPWEPQWRQLDAIGYGPGPNQTDCDEYWAYEQLLSGDGGHAMWWVDGGNANHRVFRIEDQGEVLANLVALGSIAESCPTVTWNEGGSFTVELFTPDVEALIMRFDDEASGEVTWVAITLLGDLLSVLQIPLWTRADGTMIDVDLDEITLVAAKMSQRLQDAGPDRSPPTSTIVEPPTVVAPPIITPPRPDLTIPPVILDALGEALLTAGELPSGWEFLDVDEYMPGSSDEEFVAACPAAEAFDHFDEVLVWEAELRNSEGREAGQIIGELDDAESAQALIRQFAGVADCDLSVLAPGAVGNGGVRDIEGADLAAVVIIEAPELGDTHVQLGAAAVGPVVVVFTVDTDLDRATADGRMLEFMTLGVAKVAAARS